MKSAADILTLEFLPGNPRFYDRAIAVCGVLLAVGLGGMALLAGANRTTLPERFGVGQVEVRGLSKGPDTSEMVDDPHAPGHIHLTESAETVAGP